MVDFHDLDARLKLLLVLSQQLLGIYDRPDDKNDSFQKLIGCFRKQVTRVCLEAGHEAVLHLLILSALVVSLVVEGSQVELAEISQEVLVNDLIA